VIAKSFLFCAGTKSFDCEKIFLRAWPTQERGGDEIILIAKVMLWNV